MDNNGSIYVLYYNGIITGSQELRDYNKDAVSKMYGKTEDLTGGTPMHYYNQYDNTPGGKKNEPFFDAFLVHLAMLDLKPYDFKVGDLTNIKYYKAEINDSSEPNIGGTSNLVSNVTLDKITRKDMEYKTAKHIFIMSPMTESMNEEIQEYCNTLTLKKGQNVIIHIQGDAIKNTYLNKDEHPAKGFNGDDTIEKDNGLTEKKGLFEDAFNLFSGGIAVQKFRQYLKENANILSVSPVTGTKWRTDNMPVPGYYKQANTDIIKVSFSPDSIVDNSNYFISEGLDIHKVYQDGTDKDNLASLILLGKLNKNKNIPTDFIGFRLYKSSTIPFGSKMNHTFNFRAQRNEPEYSKPTDSRGDNFGNLPFKADLTRRFYEKQRAGFEAVLKPYARNININNNGVDNFIVDGLDLLSESKRAPFNMSLYFFAPDTYQSSALIEATGAADYGHAMLAIKGVDSSLLDLKKQLLPVDGGSKNQRIISGRRRKSRKKTKKKKRKTKKSGKRKRRKTKRKRKKTKKRRR